MNIIEHNTKITKIYHISDIHINLQAKHNEYRTVFNNLYEYLKSKQKNTLETSSSIIVITGDILHSKTELLPECIELTRDFLSNLSMIMPTFFIAGNHDMNMTNENRLDALTPIYNGVQNKKYLHYLKDTNLYYFSNIIFSTVSVRDYNIIEPTTIKKRNKDDLTIALFHGRVNGALINNNIKLEGETTKKTNKTITPSSFTGYDYVIMGDIHKYQHITPNMAYSGSLIQQNHGESLEHHGVLIWNLEKKKTSFKEITNDYGYITMKINKSKLSGKCLINIDKHNNDCKYPKNIHLRILINDTPNTDLQDIITNIKQYHNIIDVVYQDNTKIDDKKNKNKDIAFNITKSEFQNKLIEEYLTENDISKKKINMIKELNTVANKTLDNSKHQNIGTWKLIKLEFSNLYSYGKNNIINFENFDGIVGIIAPNHMGKSAIIDIILYTLFDKFPRKGTLKDIINNRKDNYNSKITVQIGEWIYTIEKRGSRVKGNRTTSKCDFYRIKKDTNIKEVLNEDTSTKTKTKILEYIGDYEDIIQTNISLQHNNCNFIDAENTSRRKELERILRINFIDKLTKQSVSCVNERTAVLKHLQKKCPQDEIIKVKQYLEENANIIKELNNKENELKKKQKELNGNIKQINQDIIPNIDKELKRISINENDEIKYNSKLSLIKKQINNLSLKINTNFKKYINYNTENQKKYNEIIKSNIKEKEKLEKYKTDKIKKINNEIFKIQKNKIRLYKIKYTFKQLNKKIEKINNEKNKLKIQLTENNEKQEKQKILKNKIEKYKDEILTLTQDTLPQYMLNILNTIDINKHNNEIYTFEQENLINKKINDKNLKQYNELLKIKYEYEYIYNCNKEFENNFKRLEFLNNELLKLNKELNCIVLVNEIELNNSINDCENKLEKYKEQIDKHNDNEKNEKTNCLIDEKIEEFNDQIIKVEEEQLNSKQLLMIEQYDILKEIWMLKKDIEIINSKLEYIKSNKEKFNILLKQKKINDKLYELLSEEQDKLDDVNKELDNIIGELNVCKSRYVSNNTKLDVLKKDISNMRKIEKELELYKLYSSALKNIPYILINKVIPILEKKINELLSITTNFMVKMEIENTRIDIYLHRPIYKGCPILLNNASGFERFISSLAIRMALLEISQLPKGNFMAIDEGWNSFDYNNINNIRNIFDFLTNKFEFIMTISHIQSIREHCEHQILLNKDKDNYSYINVE